ncbi:MAG: helix-turn-helix domain-containing protein [Haloferacaceae archaeon]
MQSGIRATVAFSSPDICPIAAVSAATDTVIDAVSTSVAVCPESGGVTEFVVDASSPPDDVPAELAFSYGDKQVFRFDHDGSAGCPCECLGEFGCPPHRYVAGRGTLELVFHAADYAELQAVVAELRERYPDADVKRLVRSPTGETESDAVFVDRGKLTDRQREVLRTAYEMGYFERPRRANATDVADALDITQSTFSEHMVAAQTKVLGDLFEGGI